MLNNIKNKFTLIVFLTLPLITMNIVNASNISINNESIITEVDKISQSYTDMGWFNGTVLVIKDGTTIYEKAFGFSDLANKTPNQLNTKYNLGSIIKNYTAVLILQQVEKGNIKLEDKLSHFDLGFPKDIADKISVSQLLSHQSGFADIFTIEYNADRMAFDTIEKKLGLLKKSPLLFDPGTDHRYSNYGYVVLGAILEKITGKSYSTLLEENIFNLLKLKNTHFARNKDITNLSKRYSYNYQGKQKFVGVTEHADPAGGIETDVYDTSHFYYALFNSSFILSPASLKTFKKLFGDPKDSWHAFGGGVGISSAVEIDFRSGTEIIVLSNSDRLVAELISGRIFQFVREGKYSPPRMNEQVFTYQMYSNKGKVYFTNNFSAEYDKAGYTLFKGRVINEVGMALLEDKDYLKAIDMFETLVAVFPTAPQAYDSLAWGHLTSGETNNAKEIFSKALSISSGFKSEYSADNYQMTE